MNGFLHCFNCLVAELLPSPLQAQATVTVEGHEFDNGVNGLYYPCINKVETRIIFEYLDRLSAITTTAIATPNEYTQRREEKSRFEFKMKDGSIALVNYQLVDCIKKSIDGSKLYIILSGKLILFYTTKL